MGRKSARKGAGFERRFCSLLSQWWSSGAEECLFWRTSGSGARATSRAKKEKKTVNQDGDVAALTPDASLCLRYFSFELKKGYSTLSLQDMLDGGPRSKPSDLSVWMTQASLSARNSDAYFWALVYQRDKRSPLIIVPDTAAVLCGAGPSVIASIGGQATGPLGEITVSRLDDFFHYANPNTIREYVARKDAPPAPPPKVVRRPPRKRKTTEEE